MMDKHQRPRPNIENREVLSALSALALPKLEAHAARQLQEMSRMGALLAEAIEVPLLVKNPLCHPTELALITSRWLGGDIFGVVFPLPDGTLQSGFISMRDTLAANPHVTPSGTMAHQRWDRDVGSKLAHLLPQPGSIAEAVREISQTLAKTLLKSYPRRIDLTIRTDTPLSEINELLHFSSVATRELHTELQKGIRVSGERRRDEELLSKAIELRYMPRIQKNALEHALRIFRDTRIEEAVAAVRQGEGVGIAENLIDRAAEAGASRASALLQDALVRNPFGEPPVSILRQAAVAGLSVARAEDREFKLLWHHLKQHERTTISKIVAKRAWMKAVSDYIRTN